MSCASVEHQLDQFFRLNHLEDVAPEESSMANVMATIRRGNQGSKQSSTNKTVKSLDNGNWPESKCHNAKCNAAFHWGTRVLGEGNGKKAYYGRYCWSDWAYNNQRCVVKVCKEQVDFPLNGNGWKREVERHELARQFAVKWNKSKYCRKPIRGMYALFC